MCLISFVLVVPSSHLILYCLLLFLPSIFLNIRVFSNESVLFIRSNLVEFHLQYQCFQWTSRTDLLYEGLVWSLCSQGTLNSLLQQHSSQASGLRRSAFFIVLFSLSYMPIGQTIALTKSTFDGKVLSLLFHMLCWLLITFFPRSKHLLISWLQSPSAMILKPQNNISWVLRHSSRETVRQKHPDKPFLAHRLWGV